MRGVGDPLGELGIEVVDGGEAARGEERVAEVLDHPLDAAFLVAAGDGARLRGEVVVAGKLEQARVEADVLAESLEDDAFQVVIEQDAGMPPRAAKASTWPRRKLSSVWSRAKRA